LASARGAQVHFVKRAWRIIPALSVILVLLTR